jgi:hypothetical protein
LFQPPASLKNATNEHLPGRRPTNLVFLRALRVLRGSSFLCFNRPLRSRTPPTNIFLAEGQPTLFFFVLFVSFVVQAFS